MEEKAIDIVANARKAGKDERDAYVVKYKRLNEFYNNVREESRRNYAGKSKAFDPQPFQDIENLLSRLLDTMHSNPRAVSIMRLKNDESEDYMKVQEAIDDRFKGSKIKEEDEYLIFDMLIGGNGAMRINPDATIEYEEFSDLVMGTADARRANDVGVMVRIKKVSWKEIEEGQERGIYRRDNELLGEYDKILKGKGVAGTFEKAFDLEEYWSKDRVITCINEKFIIRDERNWFGFIPIDIEKLYITKTNSVYGKGILEIAEDLYNVGMDNLNRMIDNKNLANTPFGTTDDSNIPASLELEAGAIYHTTEGKAIKWHVVPDISMSALEIANRIETRVKNTTGNQDIAIGASLQRQEYASVVERMNANANIRTNRWLTKIGQMYIRLTEKMLKIMYKNTGDAIYAKEYEIKYNGGGVGEIARKVRVANFMETITILLSLPEASTKINTEKIIRYVAEESGFDPDNMLFTKEEMKQMEEIFAQAQAQQGGDMQNVEGNPISQLNGAAGGKKSAMVTSGAKKSEIGAAGGIARMENENI